MGVPLPKLAGETADERQIALAQALASHTLARSEQLRGFLKFICEMEIAGLGEQITESRIGQDVLGRRSDYSPIEDATVRNRTHSLRRKLEELYTAELPEATLRIELPKGGYRPVFAPRTIVHPEHGPHSAPAQSTARRTRIALFASGFVFAMALAALYIQYFMPAASPAKDRVLREFWGPLMEKDANTLVCVGTPLQLFVRPYPIDNPPNSGELGLLLLDPKNDETIYRAYIRRHALPEGMRLFANMTNASPLWGDGIGALLATQILSQAGASYELWPERAGSPTLLRGRNVILFAREEYSESAVLVSRNENFRIEYSPQHRNVAVTNRSPNSGEPKVYPLDPPGPRRVSYGLITVMPSPGVPGPNRRTIMISGLTSAGIQAAAEFFTSPGSLRDLRERFRREGHDGIPPHYQVVVRTQSVDTMPRAWEYQTHRVITP